MVICKEDQLNAMVSIYRYKRKPPYDKLFGVSSKLSKFGVIHWKFVGLLLKDFMSKILGKIMDIHEAPAATQAIRMYPREWLKLSNTIMTSVMASLWGLYGFY